MHCFFCVSQWHTATERWFLTVIMLVFGEAPLQRKVLRKSVVQKPFTRCWQPGRDFQDKEMSETRLFKSTSIKMCIQDAKSINIKICIQDVKSTHIKICIQDISEREQLFVFNMVLGRV